MDAYKLKNIAALLEHENPNLRRAAATFLGEIRAEGVLGPLAKRLRDPVWQVRAAAAWALGVLGREAAFETLLARLGVAPAAARSAVLELLSQTAPPREAADKPAASSPFGARGAGAPAASAPAAKDVEEHWSVRKALALAVARVKPDLIKAPLLQALQGQAPTVKIAAMAGLAVLQDPTAADAILPLCDDPDLQVRAAAVVALGKIRAPQAAPKLIELAESKQASLRAEAVIALNHIKPPEAFDAFLKRLNDPDSKTRKAAALALGNTRRDDAVEHILPLLADHSPDVRIAACQSLVTLKAAAQARHVAELLLDEHEPTRDAAAVCYQKMISLE